MRTRQIADLIALDQKGGLRSPTRNDGNFCLCLGLHRDWAVHGAKRFQSVSAVGMRDGEKVDPSEGEIAESKPITDMPEGERQYQVHGRPGKTNSYFRPAGGTGSLNIHSHPVEPDFPDRHMIVAGDQNVTDLVSEHARKNECAFKQYSKQKGKHGNLRNSTMHFYDLLPESLPGGGGFGFRRRKTFRHSSRCSP